MIRGRSRDGKNTGSEKESLKVCKSTEGSWSVTSSFKNGTRLETINLRTGLKRIKGILGNVKLVKY